MACGVRSNGAVVCWGSDATADDTPPAGPWVGVSVGAYHACARAADGQVACWGDSVFVVPQPPVGVRFEELRSEDGMTCGVSTDEDLWCFGSTYYTTNPEGLE